MNGKTILLLILVALAGLGLGAVGVRHIETFFASTQTTSAPRHEADHPQTEARPRGDQPTSHARYNEQRHADEKHVRLSAEKITQLGIEVAVAQAERLQERLTVPGTVTLNTDRRVHIVSRVPGVVREVRKTLGETVRAGEILAVIDSREFADAKTAYLSARERVALAEATFAREKSLWEKQISPEQDYLTARQALAEAQIELRGATHKLQALGFAEPSLHQLSSRSEAPLTRYEMVAPFAGTVIEKHITVGSFLKDDTDAFVIADLSTVWVHLNLAPTDIPLVRQGQRAVITAGARLPEATGTVNYIGPLVSEETRTVLTRVVLPNPDGRWRPGLFVTASLGVDDMPVPVLIPKAAVQTIEGQPSVFVQTDEGFEARPVTLGRADETHVEITGGLTAGERYAATETFILKADLGKGTAAHAD